MTTSAPAHVPYRRVLERVVATPGARPLRLFPLLLPMWGLEIRGTVREAQPYEVFDLYLSRGVAEGGLGDAPALAGFFGVEQPLVERGLTFLTTIGHLRRSGDALALTGLGHRSLADGCRYVEKEDRQVLYFDGFRGAPLPGTHYSGAVWLDEPRLSLADGTRFSPVTASAPLATSALGDLLHRPDRTAFNVPEALMRAEPVEVRTAWLPAYVVECTSSLLVFVKAVDGPDPYLSGLVTPYLRDVLAAEDRHDDLRVWREWLDGMGLTAVRPHRLPNGVLRAALPAAEFGNRISWPRLGSFETRRRTFLQLWCDEADVRRRCVLERAGALARAGGVRGGAELTDRLAELAAQLEVTTPDPHELWVHATDREDDLLLAVLRDL